MARNLQNRIRAWRVDAMDFVAIRMLTGDRGKYLGLIFAIALSSFLIAQQSSIFAGLMDRTRSQIRDVGEADLWVMDRSIRYVDEIYPLRDDALYTVRGVEGVKWAVPLFKGQAVARAMDGRFRSVILIGLDDASLTGAPRKLLLGSIDSLREPDAIIIDLAGYHFLFPGQEPRVGGLLEMNDHRARITGICDASPPFISSPVMFTKYSQAVNYIGRQRSQMSFVLVKAQANVPAAEVARRITEATGLRAASRNDFGWMTILYYIRYTGIPVNFGLTVAVALIVGTVVAGQTFYIFTLENLKQFGALKAIGTTNRRIVRMILLQASLAGSIGYSIGMALAAAFFEIADRKEALRGMTMPWQVMAGAGALVLVIVSVSSLISIRKVIKLEPAVVFRG
ncbi:MAG TPA: ABC transporter permease [Bryobacteraceae bacterium]|nr:ABC transporter permease [Bryobacteraceae bacterium]